MKRCATLLPLLVLLIGACQAEKPAVTGTYDEREPIKVLYVGAPELTVREQPNDTAPVVATYPNGESISILAEKGDWVEVRTGDRAGWAKASDLATAEQKDQAENNPEPKFRVFPVPVSAPSARGEVYIEADVNTEGEVTATRIITNTTGSDALAVQNANSLKSARFYPIILKGERKQLKYYHKVTY